MLITLIGLILKFVGIVLAIPNAWRQFKGWRNRQIEDLLERQFLYLRTGEKRKIVSWKRIAYRVTRMPHDHLWRHK